jgi:CDGSH-type Zn-finger protein
MQKQVTKSRKIPRKSKKKKLSQKVCKPSSGYSYEERDKALLDMGFSSYADYLNSPLWNRIRRKVYAKRGKACSLCGDVASELHHNRYARVDLEGRCLSEIHPICRGCHEAIEFNGGKKNSLSDARAKFYGRMLQPG